MAVIAYKIIKPYKTNEFETTTRDCKIGGLYRTPLHYDIAYSIEAAIPYLEYNDILAEVEVVRFHGHKTGSFTIKRLFCRDDIIKYINATNLTYDNVIYTRFGVARYGVNLNILINDNSPIVRGAVAYNGYAIDRLSLDKNEFVRDCANCYIKKYM